MKVVENILILQQSSIMTSEFSTGALILLGITSLIIGVMGGLVGIPLGVIRLPAMIAVGVDPFVAAGTNLLISVVGSAAASWPAFAQKRVDSKVVFILGVPAIIGALIGGLYADIVPVWLLLSTVSFFLLWSSISLIYRSIAVMRETGEKIYTNTNEYRVILGKFIMARESTLGGIIGLVGGASGLALAVLRMPVLMHSLKMDPGRAAGTNLAITILVGLAGFTGHMIEGRFDWTILIIAGGTAMIGMYFGSLLTGKVNPIRLRLFLGLVLLLVVPFVFLHAFTS